MKRNASLSMGPDFTGQLFSPAVENHSTLTDVNNFFSGADGLEPYYL
jgi:hypothetical protein